MSSNLITATMWQNDVNINQQEIEAAENFVTATWGHQTVGWPDEGTAVDAAVDWNAGHINLNQVYAPWELRAHALDTAYRMFPIHDITAADSGEFILLLQTAKALENYLLTGQVPDTVADIQT